MQNDTQTATTQTGQKIALAHHTTQVNGFRLHYVIAGQSEPLVLRKRTRVFRVGRSF
jgi:hypothetical protein